MRKTGRRQVGALAMALMACMLIILWLAGAVSRLADLQRHRFLDWSAIAPAVTAPLRPWRHLVIHHSGGPGGTSDTIDRDHRSRSDGDGQPWEGIGYHFVIGNGTGMPLGRIDATFRWYRQRTGAHAGSLEHNQHGIGIVLIGDFDDRPPDPVQLERCAHLCALLIARLGTLSIDAIIGHRDIKATDCPGQAFDLDTLRFQVQKLLPQYEQQRQLEHATP